MISKAKSDNSTECAKSTKKSTTCILHFHSKAQLFECYRSHPVLWKDVSQYSFAHPIKCRKTPKTIQKKTMSSFECSAQNMVPKRLGIQSEKLSVSKSKEIPTRDNQIQWIHWICFCFCRFNFKNAEKAPIMSSFVCSAQKVLPEKPIMPKVLTFRCEV